ncbi:MAG: ABC transporter permease [Thermomicrobiales bacterium]|jgi:spermidine/putrescine transport system permease protein|nr:ABC transporter permease [Thermomicrobiales bacterium]
MAEVVVDTPVPPRSLVGDESRDWRKALTGVGLLAPAIVIAIIFSIIPLIYLINVSLTRESTFFFNNPQYTFDNYRLIWNRYLPHVWTTIRLATLASLFCLIFGYPFAYILVRKVQYRDLVRILMTFPLFGPLYLTYGIRFVFGVNGPLAPLFDFIGVDSRTLLFAYPEQMTIFGMAVFTFPFMVMNVVAALTNVDPTLEEAARTLGSRPWQVFTRVLFPLSWPGVLAGFLICFGWNLGVFIVPMLLGNIEQQRVLSLALYQKAMSQFDYGLGSAMGVVLMLLAFTVTWLSLRFSRGALAA